MKLNYVVTPADGLTGEQYERAVEILTEKCKRRDASTLLSSVVRFGTIRRALAFMQQARRMGTELQVECRGRRNKHGHAKVFVLRRKT
jgi:hypothetical protein